MYERRHEDFIYRLYLFVAACIPVCSYVVLAVETNLPMGQ